MTRNYFVLTVSSKTDSELIEMVLNDNFVDAAREAASRELRRRKVKCICEKLDAASTNNTHSGEARFLTELCICNIKQKKSGRRHN